MNSGSPAKKLAVLDLKRATGIGIRMARLSVPWNQIREAIMICDEDVLKTSDDVETVLACVPSEDEFRMLQVGCRHLHFLAMTTFYFYEGGRGTLAISFLTA
jgi:hypothetical protein